MAECKIVGTPMEVNVKLSKEDSSPLEDEAKCRRLVGSLIYLCNTWLDINYATAVLSRFANKPWENHWRTRMQVLKYIAGTIDYNITYTKDNILTRFYDSDWAGDMDSRRSVIGYCFSLISKVVSWVSKK